LVLRFSLHSFKDIAVWVEVFHSFFISQGVSLLDMFSNVSLSLSNNTLDFIGVDNLSNIGIFKNGSMELVSTLFLSWNSVSSENFV
jgi:hypothetical protein